MNLIKCMCLFSSLRQVHDMNCATALAMDPVFGVLNGLSTMSADIIHQNTYMFKSKATSDPGTPTIKEALDGEHREKNEITNKMYFKINIFTYILKLYTQQHTKNRQIHRNHLSNMDLRQRTPHQKRK